MLPYPQIDPVLVHLGPLAIRWYALAYVAGILLGWRYILWINRRLQRPLLSKEQIDDMVVYAVLGVVLGGRIGYILFYQFGYYLEHPAEILKVWQGGMSFHGGLIGVLVAFWLFARKYKIAWLALMDQLAAATPIGLFFGRIANFINGELWGRATDTPWAMVFPTGGPIPRHPSQLYEAGLEGALLFLVLWWLVCKVYAPKASHPVIAGEANQSSATDEAGSPQSPCSLATTKNGLLGGTFLLGYGLARFTVEFFREPDAQLGFILGPFSMGQLLCVPMMLVGFWLVLRWRRKNV